MVRLWGGNIIEYFGWKATFYSVAPVAVLLLIIIIKQVHVKDSSQGSHTLIQQRKQFFYRNEKEGDDDDDDTAEKRTNLPNTVKKSLARLDIKGVIFLAITITSFLSALTLVQSSSPSSSPSPPSTENTIPHDWQLAVPVFLGSASLAVFIIVEKRSSSPIIDFKLISKKPVLLSNMVVIIRGICTFAIFQTIPILVQSPVQAGGLGGNAVTAEYTPAIFYYIAYLWPDIRFYNFKIRLAKSNNHRSIGYDLWLFSNVSLGY